MYHKIVYGMDMIFSILLNSAIHRLYISITRVCESALLNFVIIKIKDEGLTWKLNQMHPK